MVFAVDENVLDVLKRLMDASIDEVEIVGLGISFPDSQHIQNLKHACTALSFEIKVNPPFI